MARQPQNRRVTLYDVAQMAEVSYQTVSRVINDSPNVSRVTRQRVLKAIETLGYRPNVAARSLVTRRSYMLEVVTYGTAFFGPSQMLAGVERTARALGYNLMLTNINDDALPDFPKLLANISDRLSDGIIIISPVIGPRDCDFHEFCRGIPFVLIDNEPGALIPSVIIDQRYGGALVANHLHTLGHRAIVEIGGPLQWFGARSRHEGLWDTLREYDIAPVACVHGDWTADSGYQLTRELLARGARFTALVAANDRIALGAMRALREHGLRVPEDVSVVGYDDVEDTAYYEPPLTTVHQDFHTLGKQSVEYLVSMVEGTEQSVYQRRLYPHLVLRDSTTVPRPDF